MKIEEIEKLNAERTQGEWYANYSPMKVQGIEYPPRVQIKYAPHTEVCIINKLHSKNGRSNLSFIATTPDITDQYIKARRFEVTREFCEKVDESLPEGCTQEEIAAAVLKTMWEEIENE